MVLCDLIKPGAPDLNPTLTCVSAAKTGVSFSRLRPVVFYLLREGGLRQSSMVAPWLNGRWPLPSIIRKMKSIMHETRWSEYTIIQSGTTFKITARTMGLSL